MVAVGIRECERTDAVAPVIGARGLAGVDRRGVAGAAAGAALVQAAGAPSSGCRRRRSPLY